MLYENISAECEIPAADCCLYGDGLVELFYKTQSLLMCNNLWNNVRSTAV